MSFFQMLPQDPRGQLAEKLGMAAGQGIARNFPQPEQLVQRGMLSEAFNKLKDAPEGDYLTQLAAIAPSMLTTAGGAEALSAIAPILAQKARNKAIRGVIDRKKDGLPHEEPKDLGKTQKGETLEGLAAQEQRLPESDADTKLGEKVSPEDRFRRPQQGFEQETLYPQITAGPKIQKILSPQEMESRALDMMDVSDQTGQPMSYQDALNLVQRENENVRSYNDQILKEQELRNKNIKQMSIGVVSRAESAGMIDSPEDRTVLEQLAYRHRDEKTPADQWEKVRTEFQDFSRAKAQLRTESSFPGRFSSVFKKMNGTYKDKETIFRDLQPALEPYRKYGLFNEAREKLTGPLGFGVEDAETALFPPTKEEIKGLDSIYPNPSFRPGSEARTLITNRFPGEGANLDQETYNTFKDRIGDYLSKNPKANLIVMRGRLNQDKKYSWNDISSAINDLIQEKRFVPDLIQNQQIPIINQAPLPGLMHQFEYLIEGKK